ncbi:MAG: hypothetical protein KatS3mg110_2437 [Pirellulaceae bacterium]|nr:MAG: hypothetical protein KatS3mg110_2437 [Pirellulaceae bacterium]
MGVVFQKPDDPQQVTVWGGRNVVPVRVQDQGETIEGQLTYAYAVHARVYPSNSGVTPGDEPPDDAVPLDKVDPANHVWERVDVYEPDCSSGGTANVAYVWAKYQKPGNPPVFVTKRHEKPFDGTCQ